MTTEIPLKQWLIAEGERRRMDAETIRRLLAKDKRYAGLQFRRVNKRVVFVVLDAYRAA